MSVLRKSFAIVFLAALPLVTGLSSNGFAAGAYFPVVDSARAQAPALITCKPKMNYPANKQVLNYEGDYMFSSRLDCSSAVGYEIKLQGYLFGFFQGKGPKREMIYENLRDSGSLSADGKISIPFDSDAQRKFKRGQVEVWVRAYVSFDRGRKFQWTDARIMKISLE